jgi:hypothetical protein
MVVGLTFIVAFATVGALLAWKKPENPIGWLLSGSGLAYALGGLGQMLIHFPRTRTLGNWLGWTWLFGLGHRGGPGRMGAGQRVRPSPRPCSPRSGGGCSTGWTGGSTGPGTTPTRSRPPSPPG